MATKAASDSPLPGHDWFTAMGDQWWALVSAQWESVSAWQQGLATVQQLWNEWLVFWAGGAPID